MATKRATLITERTEITNVLTETVNVLRRGLPAQQGSLRLMGPGGERHPRVAVAQVE